MISRNPPRDVLERLRKEINFGCPVKGCGSPYLMYHHFDPPWRVKQHHNPEGMIALCSEHALQADEERWTKDQLREMKKTPYIKLGEIKEVYEYLRRNTVSDIGFIGYNIKNILEIDGERVIGFERDKDGYDRLNLLIRNEKMEPILVMENNIWTVYGKNIFDLRCSAKGRILEIISNDGITKLSMRFDDYYVNDFIKYLLKIASIENINRFLLHIGNPKTIPVWKIRGDLKWGSSDIRIGDLFVEDLIRRNIFNSCFAVNCRSAFSIKKDGSISFG